MKNISIKRKNGTILFRMVKHEVGRKQKRKGDNIRLPTFGGYYCQQKAKNWEGTNIKEMEKKGTLFGYGPDNEPKMKGFKSEYCKWVTPKQTNLCTSSDETENTAD